MSVLVLSGQSKEVSLFLQPLSFYHSSFHSCLFPPLSLSNFLSCASFLFVWQVSTLKWHWHFSSDRQFIVRARTHTPHTKHTHMHTYSSSSGCWPFQTTDSGLVWLRGVTERIPRGATRSDWGTAKEMGDWEWAGGGHRGRQRWKDKGNKREREKNT